MVYHFLYPLSEYFFAFNLTKYITFRAGCAFVTAFIIVMVFWNFTIKRLKRLKVIEKIDMYGHIHLEALHEEKRGTPTMGGVLIIFSIIISTIIWARWDNTFIWSIIAILSALGILGFCDDFLKITRNVGLSRRSKLIYQIAIGGLLGFFMVMNNNFSTTLNFPFFKKVAIELGYFYIFWVALVIISTSNAVNFTDGLDGLAIGALITNFAIFALLSYVAGHIKFASYLFVPFIKGGGELTVFCLAVVGAALAFLWFNCYPAQVFMGDVGALALGGVIGAIALFIKKEFLLFISGGLFVIEAMSVILQIISVRFRKKKLFLAAPLHHHLQLKGWKESKIIVRLWIVSIICVAAALLTLKLR